MLEEIDRYLAILGGVAIACFGLINLPPNISVPLATAALTGIFGVSGTGKKAGAQ